MGGKDQKLLHILEDLADGKISKNEAKQLIRTIQSTMPRRIRINVNDKSGKSKVNIKVPISMVSKALHWIEDDARGVRIKEQIEEALEDEEFRGEVGEIESDSASGDSVTIYIE